MNRAVNYPALAQMLAALTQALKAAGEWHRERPAPVLLASQAPFCVDTLSFTQWLQFIYLERMQVLVIERKPLPTASDVASMAALYFAASGGETHPVTQAIAEIDNFITSI